MRVYPGRKRVPISMMDKNRFFIAYAREDIPALLAEVRRLRAENERLTTSNDNGWQIANEWAAEADRLRALTEVSDPPGMCPHEDCDGKTPATKMVQGRGYTALGEQIGHPWIAYYCDRHASLVVDEGSPEYVESCPNCGCGFGVN